MEQILAVDAQGMEQREELVRPQELGELFDVTQARLYRLARRLSPDAEEARDLVQETFLRAARSPHRIPTTAQSAEAWLVQVLVNLCRDQSRRRVVRRRSAALLQPAEVVGGSPESAAVARASIQAGLARLSPRRRAVTVLHELEGQEVADVARLLGISRVTVRWHLSAARRDLREFLGTMKENK